MLSICLTISPSVVPPMWIIEDVRKDIIPAILETSDFTFSVEYDNDGDLELLAMASERLVLSSEKETSITLQRTREIAAALRGEVGEDVRFLLQVSEGIETYWADSLDDSLPVMDRDPRMQQCFLKVNGTGSIPVVDQVDNTLPAFVGSGG